MTSRPRPLTTASAMDHQGALAYRIRSPVPRPPPRLSSISLGEADLFDLTCHGYFTLKDHGISFLRPFHRPRVSIGIAGIDSEANNTSINPMKISEVSDSDDVYFVS